MLRLWSFLFLFGCVSLAGSGTATAQDAPLSPSQLRPRVVAYYGPNTVTVGEAANYRVQINRQAEAPVRYLWDFGDGILSQGSLVTHRYTSTGSYTVQVVVSNERGRDTLRTLVLVSPAPAEPVVEAPLVKPRIRPSTPDDEAAPDRTDTDRPSTSRDRSRPTARPSQPAQPPRAARTATSSSRAPLRTRIYGSAPILPASNGYAWQVGADLWQERLFERLMQYRLNGVRAAILTDDTGPGSAVYRLLVGSFDTPEQALQAKALLPDEVSVALLHDFSPPPPPVATPSPSPASPTLAARDHNNASPSEESVPKDNRSEERVPEPPAPEPSASDPVGEGNAEDNAEDLAEASPEQDAADSPTPPLQQEEDSEFDLDAWTQPVVTPGAALWATVRDFPSWVWFLFGSSLTLLFGSITVWALLRRPPEEPLPWMPPDPTRPLWLDGDAASTEASEPLALGTGAPTITPPSVEVDEDFELLWPDEDDASVSSFGTLDEPVSHPAPPDEE